jgi:hypothetical protein
MLRTYKFRYIFRIWDLPFLEGNRKPWKSRWQTKKNAHRGRRIRWALCTIRIYLWEENGCGSFPGLWEEEKPGKALCSSAGLSGDERNVHAIDAQVFEFTV